MGLSVFQITLLSSGVLVSLFSSNPLGVWMGLELNLFSILPLLTSLGKKGLTYFVAQTIGTLLFLGGKSLSFLYWASALGFCVKLGVLPYYMWFVEVIQESSWAKLWILSTIQKFHLIILLSSGYVGSSLSLGFLGSFTVLLVSLKICHQVWWKSPWEQKGFKSLLALLSILDSGVLVVSLSFNLLTSLTYFFFYSVMLFILTLFFLIGGVGYLSFFSFSFVCAKIMGFPPFLGFFVKVSLWWEIFHQTALFGPVSVSFSPYILLLGFVVQFLGYTFLFLGVVNQPKKAGGLNLYLAGPGIFFFNLILLGFFV